MARWAFCSAPSRTKLRASNRVSLFLHVTFWGVAVSVGSDCNFSNTARIAARRCSVLGAALGGAGAMGAEVAVTGAADAAAGEEAGGTVVRAGSAASRPQALVRNQS